MSPPAWEALHEPYAPLLRAALELASPPGAAVALDLCCGTGAKTAWLAACCGPGALVLGLDRERAALAAMAGPQLVADAHALPLRDATVELIWLVAALGLLRDRRAALAEARRVLRPGGTLVVALAGERWVRLRTATAGAAGTVGREGGTLPPPADGLGDELCEELLAAGLQRAGLTAYLLEPLTPSPYAAAAPLLNTGEPGEPEPAPILLVATGQATT